MGTGMAFNVTQVSLLADSGQQPETPYVSGDEEETTKEVDPGRGVRFCL